MNFLTNNGRVFYFWKGRVALYAILKAMGVGPGDEVILPGFTCVVVPNVVLYLGARPVYADIDSNTYNLSKETIEPLLTDRTRVILAQNTFGLSANLDPIMELARQRGLIVVEDCAHGLGGSYRSRPNGTVAHAAFFSTQWSKPISTGLGGIAYTQSSEIAAGIEKVAQAMPNSGLSQQIILSAQILTRPLANVSVLYYPLMRVYRVLTQNLGLVVGSSTEDELKTLSMPKGYAKRMGYVQHIKLQRGLRQLDRIVRQRKKVADYYDKYFTHIGFNIPYQPDYADHAMLRYSIRVSNKQQMIKDAQRLRIPIGDWFISPLHPVTGDLSMWKYKAGQCPVAEKACKEVINLFTDRPLTKQQLSQLFGTMMSNRLE